jgi:hypothetical protein
MRVTGTIRDARDLEREAARLVEYVRAARDFVAELADEANQAGYWNGRTACAELGMMLEPIMAETEHFRLRCANTAERELEMWAPMTAGDR